MSQHIRPYGSYTESAAARAWPPKHPTSEYQKKKDQKKNPRLRLAEDYAVVEERRVRPARVLCPVERRWKFLRPKVVLQWPLGGTVLPHELPLWTREEMESGAPAAEVGMCQCGEHAKRSVSVHFLK